MLLGGNPRLYHSLRIPGVEPNAAKLLTRLAEEHPDQPEYGLALIDLMTRKFRLFRSFQNSPDTMDDILRLSEKMLGRWPNDPQIVSAVVRFHSRYLNILRKRGARNKFHKENERLFGILEILFYNPQISDPVKEELIQLQLRQLQMFLHKREAGDEARAKALSAVIARELESYHGPRLEEFRRELNKAGEKKN